MRKINQERKQQRIRFAMSLIYLPRLARQIGGNHAALGLWQLSYWLRAAAAEPIGLGQTKGCFYNRVFPEPLSVCKAPWAPCRGNPRRGFPREKTVHRTVFSPPPALRSALPGASLLGPLRENSATAVAARGYSPLDSCKPFEKGLTENFFRFAPGKSLALAAAM